MALFEMFTHRLQISELSASPPVTQTCSGLTRLSTSAQLHSATFCREGHTSHLFRGGWRAEADRHNWIVRSFIIKSFLPVFATCWEPRHPWAISNNVRGPNILLSCQSFCWREKMTGAVCSHVCSDGVRVSSHLSPVSRKNHRTRYPVLNYLTWFSVTAMCDVSVFSFS